MVYAERYGRLESVQAICDSYSIEEQCLKLQNAREIKGLPPKSEDQLIIPLSDVRYVTGEELEKDESKDLEE